MTYQIIQYQSHAKLRPPSLAFSRPRPLSVCPDRLRLARVSRQKSGKAERGGANQSVAITPTQACINKLALTLTRRATTENHP